MKSRKKMESIQITIVYPDAFHKKLAETVGFEPTDGFKPSNDFESFSL